MNLKSVKHIYFLGIGGIGMSALARYFNFEGKKIAGYDRTPSPLTKELQKEGIQIHFDDSISNIPQEAELVIYTPAIPKDNKEFQYLEKSEIPMLKRSEILGEISKDYITIAIAGTHGKTTITSMVAHILKYNGYAVNAFIGGIANNYESNLVLSKEAKVMVVEADEFDRSFLTLHPDIAIISSMDADHLDIYNNAQYLKDSFFLFSEQIKSNGWLIRQNNLEASPKFAGNQARYSVSECEDYEAYNIHYMDGLTHFGLEKEGKYLSNFSFILPGHHNVENATASIIACNTYGLSFKEIAQALLSYSGVRRRFEFLIREDDLTMIDDYAHHPEEIKASVKATRSLFPGKKITGVFQPHLFSRTRDFMDDFADSLGLLDEIILLDIYPARELPIEGIDSEMLLNKIDLEAKHLWSKERLLDEIDQMKLDVLLMMGAGDIDRLMQPIKEKLLNK